jgi:TolB-like protein/Flp pilus assembly protein TadD
LSDPLFARRQTLVRFAGGVRKLSFFTELKRRDAYKVAVTYAFVAWLIVQIASTVLPTFHSPEWVLQALVVIVALGFPVALVLAWAFELTPEGIKRTDETEPATSKSRAWIYVALIAAIFSLGLFFFGRYSVSKPEASSGDKSIAVLPFESLSEDKNNAYFADGIQDEILARLSKIADLKVISRTSTQRFRSAPSDLREIGQKLGVSNILEGSVQKSGDAVRVTVQLIQAANDSHLWAETYDRRLSDVFGVESEVAQKIAASLEAKLTGREKEAIASIGTKNPRAYEFYLRGLSQRNKGSQPDTKQRIDAYRGAVELDPNYADAWAQLAIEQAIIFRSPEQSEVLGQNARVAAEAALRLAPDSAQAHQAMGLYYGYCRGDYQAALTELEKAQERAPNDGAILSALGTFQRTRGQVDEAVTTMQKAAELDPLNLSVWRMLASTYSGLRRFADARSMLERALALEPGDMDVIGGIALNYQAEGNLDEAWKILSQHPFQTPVEWAFVPYCEQYLLWRDYGFLIETIKGMHLESNSYSPIINAANDVLLANFYFLNRERDLAIQHAQKAEREMQELRAKKLVLYELSANYIQMAAREGNRAEVQREIDYVSAKIGDNKWLAADAESWAAAGYALLEDFEKALSLLQDSLAKPNGITIAYLQLDPVWDGVRSDPRFQRLINAQR